MKLKLVALLMQSLVVASLAAAIALNQDVHASRNDRSSQIIGPPDPIPGPEPDPRDPFPDLPRPDLPSCQEIECVPPDLPIKAR